MPKTACLRALWAFRVCICRKLRHLMVPKLSLPAQCSTPALFKPFNDCLLSLKGGANLEDETAPQQKKGPKSQKIKPPNPWKALFPRIFAIFHCINFGVAMFIGTTKLIQFNDASQPYNDAPLTNNLKSAFLHNKCTPFPGNKKSRPKSGFFIKSFVSPHPHE